MNLTREQAKIWCEMSIAQRQLTAIPLENYDIVKAYSEGDIIELTVKETTPFHFSHPRECYRIAKPKWEPKGGDWYVEGDGEARRVASIDSTRKFGIEFDTKEAAEKAAKYYRFINRLYKLAEELNEGWEPDWQNDDTKLCVVFNYNTNSFDCHPRKSLDNLTPTFRDRETVNKAIEILNQEEKYWEN